MFFLESFRAAVILLSLASSIVLVPGLIDGELYRARERERERKKERKKERAHAIDAGRDIGC